MDEKLYLKRGEFERVRDSVRGIKRLFPKIEIGYASRGNRPILPLNELAPARSRGERSQ